LLNFFVWLTLQSRFRRGLRESWIGRELHCNDSGIDFKKIKLLALRVRFIFHKKTSFVKRNHSTFWLGSKGRFRRSKIFCFFLQIWSEDWKFFATLIRKLKVRQADRQADNLSIFWSKLQKVSIFRKRGLWSFVLLKKGTLKFISSEIRPFNHFQSF